MYRVITEGYDEAGHYFEKGDVVEKGRQIVKGLSNYRRVSDGEEQVLEITDVEEIKDGE